MKHLKLIFACLLTAFFSIGQVWGALPTDPTWTATALGGIPDGATVIILNNFGTAIPNADATSAGPKKISASFNGTTKAITVSTAEKSLDDIVWTAKKTTNGVQFFVYGSTTKYLGITSAGNSNIRVNTSATYKEMVMGSAGNLMKPYDLGRYVGEYVNGSDWRSYDSESASNYKSGTTLQSLTFYVLDEGEETACATPTFSPAAGAVVSGTQVSISCSTDGATIHYTTDGTTPTASSATYTSAITVDADMTIKAIAVKDGLDNSSVASAAYTILTPKTIAEVISAIPSTNNTEGAEFLLNDVTVTYAYGSNVYVKDATGYLMIYSSIAGAANGKVLQGLCGKAKLYNGLPEISSVTKAPTVSDGTAVEPIELNAYPTDADLNKYVTLEDVTFAAAASFSGSVSNVNGTFKESTLVLRNSFKLTGVSVETGKSYRVVGVVQKYNDDYQVYPITIEEIVAASAPATPTFSVAAGEYTEVKSVELSCETDGATIYYTTDGSTPDNTSTEYTAAITVDASMTIKAIAFKDELYSATATAAYVINLPVSEEIQKTWNLAIDETATASENELTWTATYVSMSFAKANASTNANNYYPSTPNQTYTSTRAYKNSVITITPNGKQITSIVFEATSSGYATALKNSAWTNATAVANNTTITVTPTNGKNAISAVIGGTCGFTSVQVNYEAISATAPADPTFSVAAGEYTEVKSVELSCETDGATIYYTTDGSTPDNTSTEYTAAITVDENMTIKAIAYLGEEASGVAEAAYVINLPVSEEIQKTWDLSIDETATASADALTWTATYVDMSVTSGTAAANNYYPGTEGKSYTSTRFYNGATLTITPNGKQITSIVIETDGATPFKNATWTNGTATTVDKTVTITVTSPGAVTAVFQANATAFSVQVNYTDIDPSFPVAPVLTPAAGTYDAVQTVEITCETAGATIYYTTDGTAPSSASTEYTSAITVNEDMTIKAVAINGEKVGPIVTAAYKINLPLTTMDAILARATAIGGTAEEVNIQFNNWVVSGVGTDEKTVYVTDGSKGFMIYGSDHGFAVNDKISGTVACNLKLYSKVAEVVDLKANATGLTVTNDGEVNVASIALADLGAVNTSALIALNNMKYDGTYLTDGTTSIKPYNSLYAFDVFEENHYYNVTGIYVHYNTTKEIAPRSAADIEELSAEAPNMHWYVSNSKEKEIGASHIIRIGDAFAPYFETNSLGDLTYSSSDATIAEINATTGELTLKNAVGSTVITCDVAADAVNNLQADSKSFTLQVKAAATIDNVVFIAQFNDGTEDKWLAMKLDMSALEVNYHDGKIWDLPNEDQAAITWKRTDDGENVTFQVPSNDNYLKGSTGSTMSVAAGETGHYSWHWEDAGFYTTLTSGTLRTPLYQGNAGAFKYYAVGNAGSTSSGGYSELPQVVTAVFATTPEPPVEDWTEVRNGLNAGEYYTMCLDKAVTAVNGGSIWRVLSKAANGNDVILEEAVLPLVAGRPYIFRASASTLQVAYTGDAVLAPVNDEDNNGLIGSFSQQPIAQSPNNYIIYNNALYYVNSDNVYVGANRAYLDMTGVPNYSNSSPAPGRRHVTMAVYGSEEAQGIDNVGASEKPMKMMIDGQLFILRGEKMYDATGRLVK